MNEVRAIENHGRRPCEGKYKNTESGKRMTPGKERTENSYGKHACYDHGKSGGHQRKTDCAMEKCSDKKKSGAVSISGRICPLPCRHKLRSTKAHAFIDVNRPCIQDEETKQKSHSENSEEKKKFPMLFFDIRKHS